MRIATLRRLPQHWLVIAGLVLGLAVGAAINALWPATAWASLGVRDPAAFLAWRDTDANTPEPAAHAIRFLVRLNAFVGELFLRCLRFAAVPIVLFSLIVGVAGLGDARRLGRVGIQTVILYLCTAAVSVALGLGLANAIRPGDSVSAEARAELMAHGEGKVQEAEARVGQVPGLWQQALDIVPRNPFEALARADMLAIIFTAAAAGIGLTLLPPARARRLIDAAAALGEVFARLVSIVMKIAPLAVFSLIVPIAATLGADVLGALGLYVLTVLLGLVLIATVLYPVIIWVFGRTRPSRFYRGMAPAMTVAFSSSSSNATLPVTFQCVTERLGVDRNVAGFVLPLGATINMDGTALYQAVATVFIAQTFGIDLSLGAQLGVLVAAVLASIGTPGIPGAGVVMLIAILQTAGVPEAGVALILGVDRLLDMCRTIVNVVGDGVASVVVGRVRTDAADPP